jgi:ABC-type transport system involved in multi-copper enzyme maturation permease subunit
MTEAPREGERSQSTTTGEVGSASPPGDAPEKPVSGGSRPTTGGLVDTSYQPWEGAREGRLRRIGAIVRTGIGLAFDGFLVKVLIGVSYFGVAGSLTFLYIVASMPKIPFPLALGNNLYHEFFSSGPYGSLLMLLTAMVGARLISRDLKYNAISMYLSKGITRYDYLAGKFAVMAIFLFSATLLPALALWVGQVAIGQEQITWGQRLGDLGAIVAHSLVIVVPFSAAILALSSLSTTAYVPGIAWVLVYWGSDIVSGFLRRGLHAEWTKLVAWSNLTAHLGTLLYEKRGVPGATVLRDPRALRGVVTMSYGFAEPLAVLGGITLVSIAVVLWRLRKLEGRDG